MQSPALELMAAASAGETELVRSLLEGYTFSEGDLLVSLLLAEVSEHVPVTYLLEQKLKEL